MKESMWGYLIVILGVVILAVLLLVQRLTTTNEEDYYLSREVLKASMLDAVDYGTYMQEPHKLVMSREKFVAIFIRRFADSVTADKTYKIDFYDIHEYPPKATIRISTESGETAINNDGINLEINTFITGILETTDTDGLFTALYSVNGDLNADGITDITDSRELLSYVKNGTWGNVVDTTKADINQDGRIDYADVSILERAILSKYVQGNVDMDAKNVIDKTDIDTINEGVDRLSREQKILADVTCDGKVNSSDTDKIQKYISEGNVKFTCSKGDITGDGRITAHDVMVLYEYLDNKTTFTKEQLAQANINGDKKVNRDDLNALVDMLLTGKYKYE